MSESLKHVYEARNPEGRLMGELLPVDWDRFRQTLRHVPKDASSILDCGCDRGQWLDYVLRRRAMRSHLGVDISEERVKEARQLHPDLNLRVGLLEALDLPTFEVATCLEVLEHIPQWQPVLERLCRLATRRVIATVPYGEKVQYMVCVHCGKFSPMWGHLHSFSEDTFPELPGWRKSIGYILDYGKGCSVLRRIYRTIRPYRSWLAAIYDRIKEP
jgi:SAM-dependent methyltransferase